MIKLNLWIIESEQLIPRFVIYGLRITDNFLFSLRLTSLHDYKWGIRQFDIMKWEKTRKYIFYFDSLVHPHWQKTWDCGTIQVVRNNYDFLKTVQAVLCLPGWVLWDMLQASHYTLQTWWYQPQGLTGSFQH